MNKYGADSVWVHRATGQTVEKDNIHAIFFPSKLEAATYQLLLNRNLLIKTHESIQVAPPSKHFSSVYWQVDFRVFSRDDDKLPALNIESKGISTEGFLLRLQLLDRFKPAEIDNLLLVVKSDSITIPKSITSLLESQQVVDLLNLPTRLTQLGY